MPGLMSHRKISSQSTAPNFLTTQHVSRTQTMRPKNEAPVIRPTTTDRLTVRVAPCTLRSVWRTQLSKCTSLLRVTIRLPSGLVSVFYDVLGAATIGCETAVNRNTEKTPKSYAVFEVGLPLHPARVVRAVS
ncbi:hypothetical protein TcWFU_007181 [Taenia crassiceps]|uniref:Uncharacterized protein n=1 Tax=Taenia crassiceps TaxID=6207 RepID=A0ABR4QM51_9CEST